jgi:hypothetical protein
MGGYVMEEIIVEIEGESVKFEVRGAQGPMCLGVTSSLEEALGSVEKRSLTSNYYTSGGTHALVNVTLQGKD